MKELTPTDDMGTYFNGLLGKRIKQERKKAQCSGDETEFTCNFLRIYFQTNFLTTIKT
jgi:hypothetical protein